MQQELLNHHIIQKALTCIISQVVFLGRETMRNLLQHVNKSRAVARCFDVRMGKGSPGTRPYYFCQIQFYFL